MSEQQQKLDQARALIGRGRISRREFVQLAITTYAAGAAWNDTDWNNKRFNELLIQARGETDPTKRAAMYAEMQQINHDDNGNIVLVFNNCVSAASKRLGHGEVAPNWENDGLKIAERWWVNS